VYRRRKQSSFKASLFVGFEMPDAQRHKPINVNLSTDFHSCARPFSKNQNLRRTEM
jgi:hypothetical protein